MELVYFLLLRVSQKCPFTWAEQGKYSRPWEPLHNSLSLLTLIIHSLTLNFNILIHCQQIVEYLCSSNAHCDYFFLPIMSLLVFVFPVFIVFVNFCKISKTIFNLRICPQWSLNWLMDWSSHFSIILVSKYNVLFHNCEWKPVLFICVDNPNVHYLTDVYYNFNYLSASYRTCVDHIVK